MGVNSGVILVSRPQRFQRRRRLDQNEKFHIKDAIIIRLVIKLDVLIKSDTTALI